METALAVMIHRGIIVDIRWSKSFHQDFRRIKSACSGDIYYTVMDEATEVWTTPVNLSDNLSASENPGLFVGPDDTVHIVWQDNGDGDFDVFYIAL